MKPGIVIIAPIEGEVGERLHALQQRVDPRMARELPPHVTLIGSSGLGPLAMETPAVRLRAAIEPVAAATAPLRVHFEPPMRFMQTNLVVLPLDPYGPLRALHEQMIQRLRAERITAEEARFTFTPHCTLNFYRELPPAKLRKLLDVRIPEPATIERIQAFKTLDLTRTIEIFSVRLGEPVEQHRSA